MRSGRHRLSVIFLVTLAVALRLAFVLRLPDLPLYWDEVHYDHWAKPFARAWTAIGKPATFVEQFSAAFRPSIQKGQLYSELVGLVYALAGPTPKAVFLVQALLDGLTCLIVYGIAKELGGQGTGLLALALAAVYEPMIFTAGRLQTETLASLLYLAALWMFLRQRRARAGAFAAGVLLALAMLTRPALQYLSLVFLLLLPVLHAGAARRRQLGLAAAFGAGVFAVAGPQLVLTTALLGFPVWSGTLDPSYQVYEGAIVENLGWRTAHSNLADPPHAELLNVLRERGATRPTDADYRRATLRTLWHHPGQSAAVAAHKLYYAWSQPYNDSHRVLLTSRQGQRWFHRSLLVLAAIGCLAALGRRPAGLLLMATTAYLWVIYLMAHLEVRFAVTALPLAICYAALAAVTIVRGALMQWRARQATRMVVAALSACGMAFMLWNLPLARLLELLPALTPRAGHSLRVAGALATILLLAVAVAEALSGDWRPRAARTAVLPALILAMVLLLVGRPLARNWHEWHGPLVARNDVARQQFTLAAGSAVPVSGELRLDLSPQGRGDYDLVIRANGAEIRRYRHGLSRDDAVPLKSWHRQVLAGQGRPPWPWHSWYVVPVSVVDLGRTGRLDVEVTMENQRDGQPGVSLYGDYLLDDASVYDGPSPFSPEQGGDDSVEKYLGDGDFRLRRRVVLQGSTISSRWDGQRWSTTDLSAAPGRQYGRYRILLLLAYREQP
jgi:4-amino-4-deoxy-L-arabinose transferase-like glycosyltransferase